MRAPASLLLSLLAAMALPPLQAQAQAQAKRVQMTADDITNAEYGGGDLPAGQSAITAKVQLLLDRAGTSPGVIDGFRGGMSESAIKAFERRNALPQDGRMDATIWALLQPYNTIPATMEYTITAADGEGLVASIPTDYAEKAQMPSMGYTSIVEKLAERFHMDDRFLTQINPGTKFEPGAVINVMQVPKPIRTKVDRILIDKQTGRVAAYAGDRMIVDYPATVGSSATPSPHGAHMVERVAINPNYTYNPNINFKQGDNDRVLTIPPGPNGPVGNVWIALSKPTYGIHGTPTPSRLFVSQSHGCVRLTNWDAQELAHMVQPGRTVVEFLAPGVTISQATGLSPEQATGEASTQAVGRATGPGDVAGVGAASAQSAALPTSAAGLLTTSARPGVRPANLAVSGAGDLEAAPTMPGTTPARPTALPRPAGREAPLAVPAQTQLAPIDPAVAAAAEAAEQALQDALTAPPAAPVETVPAPVQETILPPPPEN
ncbi:MAG: murein L,D-transpeptidase [Paracoccus denitrificans]|nr:MAG: murein L,D-transpeptidase [Paracoccus denitrificans]PZO83987.1 MAG: murein L,D-transpeptidase [Paracoccus denitrificans]